VRENEISLSKLSGGTAQWAIVHLEGILLMSEEMR